MRMRTKEFIEGADTAKQKGAAWNRAPMMRDAD
jgi:hypothetical protein